MHRFIMGAVLFALAMSFVTFAFGGEEPETLGPPKDLCDLDVTFIQQMPFYGGYGFEYPGNVPVILDPKLWKEKRERRWVFTKEEADADTKRAPEAGETMTFTAHVINNGGKASPRAGYIFKLDDTVLKTGTLPALKPREETTVEVTWPYKTGRHWVSFEADAENKVPEVCEANNTRRDGTFGFVLTISTFSPVEYEAFHDTKNLVGSYSFEDWCQAHIDQWRKDFKLARYPATPNGVQAEVRFNRIFKDKDSPDVKAYEKAGGHLNWRIGWSREGILKSYAAGIDGGLIHELVHQCGVIDSYQIGMGSLDNLARDPFTGKTIEIPYADHRRVHASRMGGAYAYKLKGAFSEHEAAAFDATLERWGNHAGYGIYLFDMPKHNIVKFLDNRGEPLADALLFIWQQNTTEVQNVVSRVMGRIPPKAVRLDENGEFDLGSNPYDRLWVVGGSCVIMFGAYANGQNEFHLLDVTEFNIPYWRGNRETYTYVFPTNIAPLGSPPAPMGLAVDEAASEAKKAVLTWEYPKGAAKAFRIRTNRDGLCAIFQERFQVMREVAGDVRTAEIELAARAEHTYLVVTAVDAEGRESACSEYVVWPTIHQVRRGLIRPIGVAYGPDGTKYVVDNHMGALFGVDPEGSLHNYADTALIGSGRVHGVAVDSKNRVLCVGWDARGVIVIDPEKARIVGHFGGSNEPTDEPGKIYRAFGIAVDGDDRIYVSDRGNKRVQVLEPDGTHLATFIGFPDGPVGEQITGIAARSEGELVRVALVDQGAKGVWLLNFDPRGKTFSATRCIKTRHLPIGVEFGPEGNVYVGTQLGVDVYNPTGETLLSHWQSEYNPRGHQVWDVAVWEDGTMICSEGGGNEKRWYFALPEEFEPVEQ